LVYADWREECGDVDRANFILKQIMIATGKYEESSSQTLSPSLNPRRHHNLKISHYPRLSIHLKSNGKLL